MCPGKEYARFAILVFMYNVVGRFKWETVHPNEKILFTPFPLPEKGLPIRLLPHWVYVWSRIILELITLSNIVSILSFLLRSCGSIDFGSSGFGFGYLFLACLWFVLVGCGRYFINLSLLVFFFLSFFCISFYHFVMYVLVAVKKKYAQWKLQILIYCYANPGQMHMSIRCMSIIGLPLHLKRRWKQVSHPFSCSLTSHSRKSYTLNI